jgi:D-glycero-alpha-D-manno-heptose 1-phosphate guanylyltransferase
VPPPAVVGRPRGSAGVGTGGTCSERRQGRYVHLESALVLHDMDIEAIILAGGYGTRLRSVVPGPKVLAPVCGRPFVSFILDQLCNAGLRRVIVSTGYMADTVSNVIGSRYLGLQIVYSREDAALGTGGGARLAAERATSDNVLVLNGDSFCRVDMPALLVQQGRNPGSVLLAVTHVGDASRYGAVELGEGDRVARFSEKSRIASSGWINAGLYVIPRSLLLSMPQAVSFSMERDAIPKWVESGDRVYGFRCPGPFIDIGTPESLRAATGFFSDCRHERADERSRAKSLVPEGMVRRIASERWRE